MVMDDNRLAGTARNVGGKVEEGFGRIVGDAKTEAEGKVNQAVGAAQDMYGQAKDAASDAAQVVKQGASDVEDFLRSTIEQRPFTTAVVALCLGWVIGRMSSRDA
jgi:uncharacterized protein YjbJ (UPF0337 family)